MTEFSAYQHYRCRHCGVNCINRFDETVTKIGECRDCHRIPDLALDLRAGGSAEPEGQR